MIALMSVFRSGMRIFSAPVAIPLCRAMYPASRPITSITKTRSCASIVSLILSMASTAVFTAVSKPIVKSVPEMSLSMVPARPIQGILNSLLNFTAPLNDPSPPIITNPSIPLFLRLSYAFCLPSFSMNSKQRAVFKIVPPR